MSLIDEIFSDAVAPVAPPSDDALRRVAALAAQQREVEEEIAALESQLDAATAKLTRIRTKELPDLLREIGMEQFKLVDGSEISIRREYGATIKEDLRTRAHAWLREAGHGDLVKNNITLSLGRGEDDKARKIEEWCEKQGLTYERREQVHAMTLKAFVREQIEKGEAIPHDLLGVHVVDVAKITPPRAANKKRSK